MAIRIHLIDKCSICQIGGRDLDSKFNDGISQKWFIRSVLKFTAKEAQTISVRTSMKF